MAKFSSSNIKSETILIIIVIVVAIIVIVYFLNKKQECFDNIQGCTNDQIEDIWANPNPQICQTKEECQAYGLNCISYQDCHWPSNCKLNEKCQAYGFLATCNKLNDTQNYWVVNPFTGT